MDTAIIIPTYGQEDYTVRCFESIREHTDDYSLIWVDNGSDGDALTAVMWAYDQHMRPMGDKTARAKGLDIIGFYHSHPNAPAHPSQYDVDHAWPFYSYVIVSIMDKSSDAITSWILKDDRSAFDEEEIVVDGGGV